MDKKRSVLIISVMVCVHTFSGCGSGKTDQNKIESQKVDSLIEVQKVNNGAIIVKFGYDAVTAIKTTEGIVLIDAGISTSLSSRYKIIIENEFHQDNFAYIINTHGHRDHIRGNSIFPEAQIIGHENCREDAYERFNNRENLLQGTDKIVRDYDEQLRSLIPYTSGWNVAFTQKIRYKGAYLDLKNNMPFRLPDITFPDSMKLEHGGNAFDMIYFGRFHSVSDILIYVPEIKVLFTGDLFSKYGRPSMSNSSVTDVIRWMQAIKWIRKRINNIEIIIDGHGQILSTDDIKSFTENIVKMCSPPLMPDSHK